METRQRVEALWSGMRFSSKRRHGAVQLPLGPDGAGACRAH